MVYTSGARKAGRKGAHSQLYALQRYRPSKYFSGFFNLLCIQRTVAAKNFHDHRKGQRHHGAGRLAYGLDDLQWRLAECDQPLEESLAESSRHVSADGNHGVDKLHFD